MKDNKKPLEPTFSSLVISIASAAILKMGLNPESGELKDLSLARFNIDLLSILEEKTKNNLNEEELKLLQAFIKDLQFQFVQIDGAEKNGGTNNAEKSKVEKNTQENAEKK